MNASLGRRGYTRFSAPCTGSTMARRGALTFWQMPEVPEYRIPCTVPSPGRTSDRSPLITCAPAYCRHSSAWVLFPAPDGPENSSPCPWGVTM